MPSLGKTIFLVILIGLAVGLSFGPLWINAPEGMPAHAAQRALAVFLVCLALWLTHAIPLAMTGLLAFALLSLLGVTPTEEALAHLGNQAVFFMLGVFFLAAAMIATGLSKRLTLLLIGRLDQSPRALFTGVLVSSSFLALWMPEHAVAAMMFPIVIEIVQALKLPPKKSRFAQMLFMALAWGAVIGGVGTFLGGARAPLAISLLEHYTAEQISFLEWMIAAIPLVVILTLVAVLLLPMMVGFDVDDVSRATTMIHQQVAQLGKMRPTEWRLAILGLATILCWILWGHQLGPGVIAIASTCALFVLRIVTWQQLQDYINWGVLLMYGGAIAIGAALHDTAALTWFVHRVQWAELPPSAVLILVAVVAIVLTECISNAATVAALLPIGYSICAETQINPVAMTLAVTIPAGLPFCLPVSSPPHAIAFSSGYYEMRSAVRPGGVMNLIALVVFAGVVMLYWPLIGLSIVAE